MSLDVETCAIIEAAAVAAYDYTADEIEHTLTPTEIYKSRQCRMVTGYMSELLRKVGVEVETISRGGIVDEHRYLRLGDAIIDATWQQFLPQPGSDDLPKVYIGNREGLQDLVDLNGADPLVARLWDIDGQGKLLTVQERIAAAYDATH